jgi:hypothetical protein
MDAYENQGGKKSPGNPANTAEVIARSISRSRPGKTNATRVDTKSTTQETVETGSMEDTAKTSRIRVMRGTGAMTEIHETTRSRGGNGMWTTGIDETTEIGDEGL